MKASTVSSSGDSVLTKDFNDKGVIILNRQKALNAINLEMVKTIKDNLEKWENTKKFVIIKGAGEKSFCAGGDVVSVVKNAASKESKQFFENEYQTNALIGSYKIPYIALIDGITMGGGVGLSVHGKFRIATERTLFAMPETKIGLFTDVGGSYFLPRLPGKLGLFLALTGCRLKGEETRKFGIATHYCDSSKLPELENELLHLKDSNEIPKILNKFNETKNVKSELDEHINDINKIFNASSVEEIIKNLENHNSKWSKNILNILSQMSPTSLKVVFHELNCGAKLSFFECLKMEYRMVIRHLENSDFKEGVRALLIDKDQKPNWNPPKLEEVTKDRVESFFRKLPENEELQIGYADQSQVELERKSKL